MTLFSSLQSAARAAIAHDNIPGAINAERWAITYRCSPDDVREALRVALNGKNKLPEETAVNSIVPTIQEDSGK